MKGVSKETSVYHTKLVKVRRVDSEGVLGVIVVTDYHDILIKIVRNNITSEELKECTKDWVFMKLEEKKGKLIYVKHVVCSPIILATLKSDLLSKKREELKNKLSDDH